MLSTKLKEWIRTSLFIFIAEKPTINLTRNFTTLFYSEQRELVMVSILPSTQIWWKLLKRKTFASSAAQSATLSLDTLLIWDAIQPDRSFIKVYQSPFLQMIQVSWATKV